MAFAEERVLPYKATPSLPTFVGEWWLPPVVGKADGSVESKADARLGTAICGRCFFFFFFILGQGDLDTFVLEPEFVGFERDPPAPFEFTVKNESSCDRRDFFCLSVRTLHFETNNAGSRLDISMPL